VLGVGFAAVGFEYHIDGRKALSMLVPHTRSKLKQQFRTGNIERIGGAA
jgi:hypothetical protein